MVMVEPPCSWRPWVTSIQVGLGQAQEVHATVLKEAPVFDGQHRIHHQLRNFIVGDQLPLGPVLGIEQGSDHLRFEFVGRQIAGFAGDAFHLAARGHG